MKIISIDVMSTGVIAYYVLIAARNGLFTPIVSDVQKGAYADPVPQAVILTAIVSRVRDWPLIQPFDFESSQSRTSQNEG